MRIPMARPSMTDHELKAVESVFQSGWLGEGQVTADFERELCRHTGAPHVVAVNTGTAALHLSLAASGVEKGDEVIMPSFTFASDAMAVHLCGATPVFGDIHPDTLNLDPQKLASLVTERTRAVLPTDYAGLPADIAGIKRSIDRADVLVIRDASHSFGSTVDGRPVGLTQGEDATCFSFDPIKNITCGEGGAVLVKDAELAERLESMKNLGFQNTAWKKLNGEKVTEKLVATNGFRYHMPNLNAAIGLAQLTRLSDIRSRKCAIARAYDAALAEIPGVQTFHRNYEEVLPFIYPLLVLNDRRDELMRSLADRGIHAGIRYTPCHYQPFFRDENAEHLPVTEHMFRNLICLPIHAELSEQSVQEITAHIKSFINHS